MKKILKKNFKRIKLITSGFTLIELLVTVILLAIVALIATPIILNVIEDARNSADMSSAQLIVNEGHNYYAGAMLDEVKQEDIELEKDIYDKLNINNKPEIGQLYVNKENKVAMAIIINNKCYKKTYYSEIEVVENVDCDLGYMGPDDIKPTVNQKVINTSINENNWYKEDMYIEIEVKDNESGPAGYKRCMGQDECEPEETIYKLENKIYINTESATNYVCVIGIDNKGNESEKSCVNYKLDKTIPNIEGIGDKVVQKDEVVDLKEGIIVNDTLSEIDREIIIEPSSIDTSITGTKQVTYKVKDKAGNEREVIRNIIVDAEAPTIVYNLVNPSSINGNGWAKENFYVRATITDNSGSGIKVSKSCTSNSSSECVPTADISGTTKDFYIEVEGNNRLCIEVTDNNNKTTKICSDTYKLDKTAPVAGTASIVGTMESNGWYTSDVTVNVVNGNDSLSGHSSTISNVSSITNNTTGQVITITTTDLAGNSASRSYTIKLDKNSPTLTDKGGSITITQGDSYVVSNYFNVGYSISGGNVSCNPANTNSLGVGTQTVSCTATGGNGKSVTANKSIVINNKNLITIMSGLNGFDGTVRNTSLPRIYYVRSDGTVIRYQEFRLLSSLKDAKDGFNVMQGINNVKSVAAYSLEELYTINKDNSISHYTCPYNSTSCTKEDIVEFGNDVIQLSGDNYTETDIRNSTMPRIYALKSDGTVIRYQKFRLLSSLKDAKDGFNVMQGINNAKQIAAYSGEQIFVLNNDNTISLYRCPYNSISCTKEKDMTEFGTDIIQMSNQNSEDLNERNTTLPRMYLLKKDGTVMRYQEFRLLSSLKDAKDGLNVMSGINNVKYIAGYALEKLYVIKNDNTIWQYTCLYNSTSCTGEQVTGFN